MRTVFDVGTAEIEHHDDEHEKDHDCTGIDDHLEHGDLLGGVLQRHLTLLDAPGEHLAAEVKLSLHRRQQLLSGECRIAHSGFSPSPC